MSISRSWSSVYVVLTLCFIEMFQHTGQAFTEDEGKAWSGLARREGADFQRLRFGPPAMAA